MVFNTDFVHVTFKFSPGGYRVLALDIAGPAAVQGPDGGLLRVGRDDVEGAGREDGQHERDVRETHEVLQRQRCTGA